VNAGASSPESGEADRVARDQGAGAVEFDRAAADKEVPVGSLGQLNRFLMRMAAVWPY
jgi:hypothetical protein